jgi:hypothetical protein
MKATVRHFLQVILALLVLLQGVVPTFASALITMRCAGEPVSAMPCASETLTAPQATPTNIMALMPCCRGMAQAVVAAASTGNTSYPQSIVFSRHCIVTVHWSPAGSRPVAAPSRARWLLSASPALAPPAREALYTIPADSSACPYAIDTGPPSANQRHLLSHGLRAPPTA